MRNHGLAPEDVKLLAYRVRRILTRLHGLSEAPAGKPMEDRLPISRKGADSAAPPMTSNQPRGTDRPPSRDLSLYEHYRWRFGRAEGDLERIELLCLLAERDYWETSRRGGRGQRPAREITSERNRRIINEYEGLPLVEVAVFERVSSDSVRKLRKEFGRDPSTGRKLAA